MTRVTWNNPENRLYETGVDRGVLYLSDGMGIAWNGLLSVNEDPTDVDASTQYFDGAKYYNRVVGGNFAGTIEAFTYPDEFSAYDGYYDDLVSRQTRRSFGFSYRTKVETEQGESGYKIHLVYNVLVVPTTKDYATESQNLDLAAFNWSFTTTPEVFAGVKPFSHLVVDSTVAHSWTIRALEEVLYGNDSTNPRLPLPAEVLEIFESNALLRIVDHGDGTWSAIGSDEAIQMLNDTTFQITSSSASYLDEDTYSISSL